MNESKLLSNLMKRGGEFLNCEYPVICGAMTWVSEPELAAAVSNSGGFGCLAGGIATGKMMAHTLLMGAAGVQLGTRFVMTEECRAHEKFKAVFRRANARDAISTPQYDSKLPVVAVRALRNKGLQGFGQLQLTLLKQLEAGEITRENAQEQVETFWMGALRKAVVDGDVEHGSLMAGQSVGLVDKIVPVRELIAELIDDASGTLENIKNKLNAI